MLPPAAASWVSVGQSGMERQKLHRERWVLAEKRDYRRPQHGSRDSSFRMEEVASSVSLVLHSWTRTEFAGVGLSSLSCRANNERECES